MQTGCWTCYGLNLYRLAVGCRHAMALHSVQNGCLRSIALALNLYRMAIGDIHAMALGLCRLAVGHRPAMALNLLGLVLGCRHALAYICIDWLLDVDM